MPSSITWLQFDAELSRRARELVRPPQEPSTLDSLPFGTDHLAFEIGRAVALDYRSTLPTTVCAARGDW